MKPVRGLPTRRTPKNNRNTNPTTSSGHTSSGWDRFNGKMSPSEKERLREKLKEFLREKDSDTSDELVVSD